MNLPRPKTRSFWRRRERPLVAVAPAIDPADMGTCFGLELSMDTAAVAPSAKGAEPDHAPWWARHGARKAFGA